MKIKIEKAIPVTLEEIEAVERLLQTTFDDDYRTFLMKHNGGRPEDNVFPIKEATPPYNKGTVTLFLPLDKIAHELAGIEGFPEWAYPIAHDPCGNYIFLSRDVNDKCLYFWDHEMYESNFIVADSFSDFLSSMVVNNEPVKLKEGQVISAWIDPEFLRKIKEEQRGN